MLINPVAIAVASAALAALGGIFIALCGVCAWARCTIVGVIIGVLGTIIALIILQGFTSGCAIAAASAAVGFLVAAIAILLEQC